MLPIPSETSISCQQLVLGNDNMNTKYNISYMRITNTDSYIEDKENMFYVLGIPFMCTQVFTIRVGSSLLA